MQVDKEKSRAIQREGQTYAHLIHHRSIIYSQTLIAFDEKKKPFIIFHGPINIMSPKLSFKI